MDATLREITSLVKEVNPEARRKGTMFDFSLVFPNPQGPGFRFRDVGTTVSGQKGPDDGKTLSQLRYQSVRSLFGRTLLICVHRFYLKLW